MGRPSDKSKQVARRELNDKQLAYVIWAAIPEGLRVPSDKNEFADTVGVARQTLWRWERDPRVLDAIRFVVVQNAGDPARVTQVLDMVAEAALDRASTVEMKLKAAEVWLRATGVMSQFQRGNSILDVVEESEGFSDFSDAQLESLKEAALANAAEMESLTKARVALAQQGDAVSDRLL